MYILHFSDQIITFTEHSLLQLLGIWNPVLCWSEERFWLGFQRLIKHERTAAAFGESAHDPETEIGCHFTAST